MMKNQKNILIILFYLLLFFLIKLQHNFFIYKVNQLFKNILIKDITKFISTTDKDSFYECTINCTLYEKFNNINIIKTQFSKELFSDDNNISMMINHGDFLEYSNKTEFKDFINENDIFEKI